MRRTRMLLCAAAAAAAAMLLPGPATALINETFTPRELVKDSDAILQLELGPVGAKGDVQAGVVKALKGKAPGKTIVLDLSRTAGPQAKAFREMVGPGKRLALLFTGVAVGDPGGDGGPGGAAADSGPPALLNAEGRWYRLLPRAAGGWDVQDAAENLLGVWAGGTDMLLRGIQYVLSDPQAAFPVSAGVGWAACSKIATVPGDVSAAMAVDLGRRGDLTLMVCSSQGDRLLQCQAGKREFRDVTAEWKLASKSRVAAWADFDADGRLDLASFDGKALTLWLQTAAGRFEAGAPAGVELAECTGLIALDVGHAAGRAGLLVSTAGAPVLLTPGPAGGFTAAPVSAGPAGQAARAGLGQAYACLLADLDGDGLPDIVQPLAGGALFYKGTKLGAFAAPARIEGLAAGPGGAMAFLGDYDADGLLDVFLAARQRCGLWRNLGGGRLAEAMRSAGEVAYISKAGAIGGATCDFNNDGRQDVCVLYAGLAPQFFFNRGFACFGHARDLGVSEGGRLPQQAEAGQQAGTVADLDGDGGQDLAMVLAGGDVWVAFRDAGPKTPTLAARVALAAGARSAGPVTVTASSGKRPLGAWNLAPGQHAFIAPGRPGPCVIEWRLPGRPGQSKQVIVTKSSEFVTLP